MINKETLKEICDYAFLNNNDIVLEIGAGTGNLTKEILKRVKKVIAIEKDKKLIEILKKETKEYGDKIEIIEGNFLKINLDFYFNKIVSNIPYSISRKIFEKILTKKFEIGIFVVQKEFAKKIVEKRGKNYRAISVLTQTGCDVEILKYLNRNVFYPIPNVDSAIIKLKQKFPLSDEYIKFVKNLFGKRNKKIFNRRIFEFSPQEIFNLWNMKINY
ncbi:MAG: 16S rRNA (adenine(1518)-N(6)/adenine(1519)-N(6))-dimethyltransferase RsmA [Candidatus Altarchaeaceae archaeon]